MAEDRNRKVVADRQSCEHQSGVNQIEGHTVSDQPNPSFQGEVRATFSESTPWWPPRTKAPLGAPNILVVLFDDVGFSDFGCYGSPIKTPTIDRLAAQGLRYTGFHTTAMCSTTRAALLTGRNHHSVGVGCLANFDSGFPGYRGKIAKEAGTLAEMLRPHTYRNYIVGKWHVTPLTEVGATGPFDGWPLGRAFDRFYGFMDAETDQYAPELVLDNSSIDAPGTFERGYHLTTDLIDRSIGFLAGHAAKQPDAPWLLWLALGACHAPHQAPFELIKSYDAVFKDGWDAERLLRIQRQKATGIVPASTRLPPRNDGVQAWEDHSADERRFFTRLQSAYAAMLDHADRHLARLIGFLEQTGMLANTIVLVTSDNGASQGGGPLGYVNSAGPRNFRMPLDDRFRERFVVNANRFHGARKRYVFHAGMGHLPTDVAPDVRSRSYLIEADVHIAEACEGVLIAHGDATTGYSLYLQSGHLMHDINIGGEHVIVRSEAPVPRGERRLGVRVRRLAREVPPTMSTGPGISEFTLLIDGTLAGRIESRLGVPHFFSWAGPATRRGARRAGRQ